MGIFLFFYSGDLSMFPARRSLQEWNFPQQLPLDPRAASQFAIVPGLDSLPHRLVKDFLA